MTSIQLERGVDRYRFILGIWYQWLKMRAKKMSTCMKTSHDPKLKEWNHGAATYWKFKRLKMSTPNSTPKGDGPTIKIDHIKDSLSQRCTLNKIPPSVFLLQSSDPYHFCGNSGSRHNVSFQWSGWSVFFSYYSRLALHFSRTPLRGTQCTTTLQYYSLHGGTTSNNIKTGPKTQGPLQDRI